MIKFEQLKKELSKNLLSNYILVGNDNYILEYAYSLIKQASGIVDYNMNEIILPDTCDDKTLINSLLTIPFLSDKKIVYVKGVLPQSVQEKIVPYIKSAGDTIFVINAQDNETAYKTLLKHMEKVDCNKLPASIISKFIVKDFAKHNKQITNKAINLLMEYCLFDMTKITVESQKLLAYAHTKDVVDESDVESIVTKSEEYSVFELTEALAKGDGKRAYAVLNQYRDKQNKTLLYLIYNHFRRMFYVKVSKKNLSEYVSLLQVKEFAIKKAIEQAKLFSATRLKSIIEEFARLDEDIKVSKISADNAIDYIVLYILDKK